MTATTDMPSTTPAPAPRAADKSDAGTPLVSIVIAMYNEARYIGLCLDSILAQDFDMSRCEIIVVDGRSQDDSAAIVRSYCERYPNVRLLDNPRRVQVAALNLGAGIARGRYMLQMDSHCRYQSDYIRQVVATFERTGAANVAGQFVARPGDETTIARAIWLVQGSRFGAGASYGRQPGPERMVGENEHVTSGWSFRRDLFDRVGWFDERLISNHDNDMSCRAHEAGLGVCYNPAIVAEYFSRARIWPFLRTMFRNGYYLMPMWRIRPSSFALMHAVPMAFVLTLLVSGVAGLFWPPAWWLTAAALGSYGLVDMAVSIGLAARHGAVMLPLLPWLFLATHGSYGIGTVAGVIRFGLGRLPRAG